MVDIPPKDELDELMPLVYDDLRQLASRALAGERRGRRLQTTELVHEVYVRLASLDRIKWRGDSHILRAAVGAMRRVIIDHARAATAKKRTGDGHLHTEETAGFADTEDAKPLLDLLALDEALNRLKALDPRKADIVEMRFFGDQSIETTASVLGISTATVKRDWNLARAWLARELDSPNPIGYDDDAVNLDQPSRKTESDN